MITLGITGRSGCGKSTVTAVFSAHGVPLADADQLSREILLPFSPLLPVLAERFGEEILRPDGSLDRRLLADRAFATPEGKAALDLITHPEIVRRIRLAKQAAQEAGAPLFVLDGAVIVGTAAEAECDRLAVVTAPFETSVARIAQRDGIAPDMAAGKRSAGPRGLCAVQRRRPCRAGSCRVGALRTAAGRGPQERWCRSFGLNVKKLLNGLVLVFLLVLGVLCLPPVRTQMEKAFYPCKYSALVEQYAAEYDLDPLLVYSFIRTESGFDPAATSSVNARGLMQMTEETFLWMRSKLAAGENVTFDDLYDPAVSLRYGCYYLHLCLQRYNGDVATAAAAYHSGWGTVDTLLQMEEHSADGVTLQGFPYNQMHHYVEKITACYAVYTRLYGMNQD